MKSKYAINQILVRLERTQPARQAARKLAERIHRYGGDASFTENEQAAVVSISLGETWLTEDEIRRLDRAFDKVGIHAQEGFVIEYCLDGERGLDLYGPDRPAQQAAWRDHHAHQIATAIAVAGGRYTAAAYEPALKAILNEGIGHQKSLVLGFYEDTGEQAMFVLEGEPADVEMAMRSYLHRLGNAIDPDAMLESGMPDSAAFRITQVFDLETLLHWIALLDPGLQNSLAEHSASIAA